MYELFLPEIYAASSLKDFIENRQKIIPTRKIIPPAVFANGIAIVVITSKLSVRVTEDSDVLSLEGIDSSVLLTHNGYPLSDKDFAIRSHLISSLKAQIGGQKKTDIYFPDLSYNPSTDLASLLAYSLEGPQTPQSSKHYFFSGKEVPMPA